MFWMRVAMGIFRQEPKEREERILELYGMYKSRRFCSSMISLLEAVMETRSSRYDLGSPSNSRVPSPAT